jgi:HprK-related kinase A
VSGTEPQSGRSIGDCSEDALASALREDGLWLDLGAAWVHVQSDVPALAGQLRSVYRRHPFRSRGNWADLHVRVDRRGGPRRWLRPQAIFRSDSAQPFEPFPADSPLPLLEWGGNWLIGQRLNHLLLLHAGVVEKGGRALVMPALPGSGKSTLTAGLSLRGWRLLSDEFGAFDPEARVFWPLLKPVALKNQSIAIIRGFAAHAHLGPEFPKTRKGTVVHLATEFDAVHRRTEVATPGLIVLPQWRADHATKLEPVEPRTAFGALAFNAFNYKLLGSTAFDAVVHLTRTCQAFQLVYSDLESAVAALDKLWLGPTPRCGEHLAAATAAD